MKPHRGKYKWRKKKTASKAKKHASKKYKNVSYSKLYNEYECNKRRVITSDLTVYDGKEERKR